MTGKATYDGDTLMAKLLAHRDQPIPNLRETCPQVPEPLQQVFQKMVAKKLGDRYQSMTEVIAALESCSGGQAVSQSFSPSAFASMSAVPGGSVSSPTSTGLPAGTIVTGASQVKAALPRTPGTEQMSQLAAATSRAVTPGRAGKQKNRKPTGQQKGRKPWLLIGGGLAGVLLLSGIVFSLLPRDGQLVVRNTEPEAEVQVVDAEGRVITREVRRGEKSVTVAVAAGKHQLKVQKQGFKPFRKEFELASGKTATIDAKLVPVAVKGKASLPAPEEEVAADMPSDQPGFQRWLKDVRGMPAEKQLAAVSRKLMELNPGFDGKLALDERGRGSPLIDGGRVVELQLFTDHVTDLSPLRAFTQLRGCISKGSDFHGILSDLTPLQGLPLTTLVLTGNPRLSDLSPLQGMPLTRLVCFTTAVSDLTPLEGMKLKELSLRSTAVVDLSPLQGMPLTQLDCYGCRILDLSPLQGMKLTRFENNSCQATDFTPLRGMPLIYLILSKTSFADLSILEGMPLTNLELGECPNITDLSPVRAFPLKHFQLDFKSERDTELLRSLTTLERINGLLVADFWKSVEGK